MLSVSIFCRRSRKGDRFKYMMSNTSWIAASCCSGQVKGEAGSPGRGAEVAFLAAASCHTGKVGGKSPLQEAAEIRDLFFCVLTGSGSREVTSWQCMKGKKKDAGKSEVLKASKERWECLFPTMNHFYWERPKGRYIASFFFCLLFHTLINSCTFVAANRAGVFPHFKSFEKASANIL